MVGRFLHHFFLELEGKYPAGQTRAARATLNLIMYVLHRACHCVTVKYVFSTRPHVRRSFLAITCDSVLSGFEVPPDKLEKLETIITHTPSKQEIRYRRARETGRGVYQYDRCGNGGANSRVLHVREDHPFPAQVQE